MDSTVADIYDDLQIRLGKDFRGGYVNPSKFNTALRVIVGRKMNMVIDEFEQTREVTSDLIPFVVSMGVGNVPPMQFTAFLEGNNDNGGYAKVPSDYWYECRANWTSYLNNKCSATSSIETVEFVSQHRFGDLMGTSLYSPVKNSKENAPLLVVQNENFCIYPYKKNISFSYLRKPNTPFYDYILSSGVPVYLPPGAAHNGTVLPIGTLSRTVQVEFPESCYDEIVEMLVKYFAKADENAWNLQTSEKVK